jgi:hypothetical protein
MAYVYVRDEDSVIVGVYADQQTTPAGHTEHVYDWKSNGPWWVYKIIWNGPGDFTNTGIPHPDENDGLI